MRNPGTAWSGRLARAAFALLALSASAVAQTNDRLWADCAGTNAARALDACTGLLSSLAENDAYGRARAHYNRGVAQNRSRRPDAALADFDAAVRLDPDYPAAFNARGNIHRDRKEFDKALADFETAVRLDPASASALTSRGLVRLEGKNDREGALADYEAAIRADANFGRAYNNRGVLHRLSGRLREALADFDKALAVDPPFLPAEANRAQALAQMRRFEPALAAYDAVLKREPRNAVALAMRGFVRSEGMRDHEGALQDYEAALRINPTLVLAYMNRGITLTDMQQCDRALADLDKAIELDRNFANPHSNRGRIFIECRRDLPKAMAALDTALTLNPRYANAYSLRAAVHRLRGDFDAALADLDRAQAADPGWSIVYQSRGFLFVARGEPERAVADFDRALALEPTSIQSLSGRGFARQRMGEWEAALADYAAALARDPGFTLARVNSGLVLEKLGRVPEARLAYEQAIGRPPRYSGAQTAQATARKRLEALAAAAAPAPERRVALLIANSRYGSQPALRNPANDVRLMEAALKRLGFATVTLREDLTRDAMLKALAAFGEEAAQADWALVYYAGHGMAAEGRNYLLPVDVRLRDMKALPREAVTLDEVQAAIARAKVLRLVIVDACRDNPFAAGSGRTPDGRGALAPLVAPGLTFVSEDSLKLGDAVFFAAKANQKALDGDGDNSPFVLALARHLETPGMEINRLFRAVTVDVIKATGERQRPFAYESLPNEDFLLRAP